MRKKNNKDSNAMFKEMINYIKQNHLINSIEFAFSVSIREDIFSSNDFEKSLLVLFNKDKSLYSTFYKFILDETKYNYDDIEEKEILNKLLSLKELYDMVDSSYTNRFAYPLSISSTHLYNVADTSDISFTIIRNDGKEITIQLSPANLLRFVNSLIESFHYQIKNNKSLKVNKNLINKFLTNTSKILKELKKINHLSDTPDHLSEVAVTKEKET